MLCSKKRSMGDMAFFTARIISKDGVVIVEDIEVWINFFRLGYMDMWAGGFAIPVTTPLTQHTVSIRLTDGREDIITDSTTQIQADNIAVYVEGKGQLA